MLRHDLAHGILVITPEGALSAEDFAALARVVDPYLDAHGHLEGLLIDAPTFPGWEGFGALTSHLRFVRDHHRALRRVAVVSDSAFLKAAPKVAAHFVAAEVKTFGAAQRAEALAWLHGGLSLYQLGASPNSIKVRLALGLKKLPCQVIDTDPTDDSKIVALSGQALRPILVHGGRTIYDSHAILRYLDANWRVGPRLFGGDDADAQHEIEDWEQFARDELGAVIGMIFGQFFAPTKDPAQLEAARAQLAKACARVEEALGKSTYLMGAQPNAADCTLAAFVGHALLDPARQASPVMKFFAEHLRLPAQGFDRTRAWAKRVLAHDCAHGE